MAHNVSNEYKQVIYSGDARNKLKLLFNNVELQDADRYCEKLTVKSRIIPNGAKIFNLNNFISKEAELILHDIDTSIIQNQVSISIGTLVGNSYEYVPIGIFNIENQPTNDKNKTTIKLRDNSVKFDFNYNAQPLIEQNGGVATKLQILQDICSQVGVTCNITSFVGYLDEIGVYDNTITAREYISRIAEQAGKIATINRSGELIFVDLNNLTTWEIPIEIVEKYENGTKFKIGRVVYEDGIVRYETPTSNDDTLFLDGSNNYINGELVKEQANSSNNSYTLQNTGEADLAYFEMEGKTTQETRSGKNKLNITLLTSQIIKNGITITPNNDGTIILNGTSTSEVIQNLTSTNFGNVSFNSSRTSTADYKAYSNSTDVEIGYNPNNKITYLYINTGITFNNFKLEPMVLLTSETDTSFEPYGAMPSPDYPSELVSVGYENLLENTATTQTINGITFTRNADGTITTNGTATANTSLPIKLNFELKDGEKYRFSCTPSGGSTSTYYTYINQWYSGDSHYSNDIGNGIEFTYNIASKSSNRVQIQIANGTTLNNAIFKPMITKGIQAHSYIPYGKYGIEVKTTGKNLLEPNFQSSTSVGVSITYTDDGWLLNGTLTSSYTYFIIYDKNLSAGTYTINGVSGASNNTYQLALYKNGTIYAYITTTNRTFTLTEDTQITIRLYVYSNYGAFNNLLLPYQLEKGNQATTYEEYKTKTYLYTLDNPLRSIGDTKDLLYIKNGMLYVDRKIGSVVLDGSEDWGITSSTSSRTILYTPIDDIEDYISINNMPNLKSNYFNAVTQKATWKNGDISRNTISKNVFLTMINGYTVTNFKTWLSTHNTEVQYVLAEPYTEELGQVDMPSTYEGITYIDILSNINTNSYLQYRQNKTQLEAILQNTNQFSIDSLKTGKILGNPAIDPYDLIQIHDVSKNLFKPILSVTKNGMTLTNNGNGSYVLNGTSTAATSFWITGLSIPIGTYTMSANNLIANSNASFYFQVEYVGGGMDRQPFTIVNSKKTFTSSKVINTWSIIVPNGLSLNNFYIRPQLEQGSVATDFIPYKDETYTTLATNDLTYTGVLINTFDTQIGEEAKEQNVFVNGEETFKKWARTTIDNVEGSIKLQAGQIDEANGKINETNFIIEKDGALLNVLANNSNIDVQYDSEGNPLSGEVREVTTTTGFKFNAEGMTIEDTSSNFKALHRNTGTYYKEGDSIVGQYTKDGSKQKDLELFGVYYYGKNDFPDTPMFVAQLYTDENGEEAFGHFYNRGD